MTNDTMAPVGILVLFFGFAFAAAMLGLLVWSLVWVCRDANQRGKQGWLVALLCFLFSWPFSILMWVVFRPEFDGLPMGKPARL